jgi:hypothetical protein
MPETESDYWLFLTLEADIGQSRPSFTLNNILQFFVVLGKSVAIEIP